MSKHNTELLLPSLPLELDKVIRTKAASETSDKIINFLENKIYNPKIITNPYDLEYRESEFVSESKNQYLFLNEVSELFLSAKILYLYRFASIKDIYKPFGKIGNIKNLLCFLELPTNNKLHECDNIFYDKVSDMMLMGFKINIAYSQKNRITIIMDTKIF